MTLDDYLRARGESEVAFARRCGVPQSTINLIRNGGGTRVETAAKIVKASRIDPAPGGGTITYDDFVDAKPEDAA